MATIPSIIYFSLVYGVPLWLWVIKKPLRKLVTNNRFFNSYFLALIFGGLSIEFCVLWALSDNFYIIIDPLFIPTAMSYIGLILYTAFFFGVFLMSARTQNKNNLIAIPFITLCLALWSLMAISELWEMPFHAITWMVNLNMFAKGLLFSSLRLLGLYFFFITVWRVEWRPDFKWWWGLGTALVLNVALYDLIQVNMILMEASYGHSIWYTGDLVIPHLNRIPWMLLFLYTLYKVPRGRLFKWP